MNQPGNTEKSQENSSYNGLSVETLEKITPCVMLSLEISILNIKLFMKLKYYL
jgi:hypothetical protein